MFIAAVAFVQCLWSVAVLADTSLSDTEPGLSTIIDETLNGLQQNDPRLIEIVRKRLIRPADPPKPYNFSVTNPDLDGQYDQVLGLRKLLDHEKGGFFVEAGAFDGEEYSNSLYFEMLKGWHGLLVEPNPDVLTDLLAKNRRATVFPGCLSTKTTPEIVEFDAAGAIGGIVNQGREPGGLQFRSHIFQNLPETFEYPFHRRPIRMQCFPLFSVLMAMGNPTVDLFSLDIEGAELPVLGTIPWDQVNIRVLVVEVNHLGQIFKGSPKALNKLLKKNGFKYLQSFEADDLYVKRDFKVTKRTKTEF